MGPDAWLFSSGVDCHDVRTMLRGGHWSTRHPSHSRSSPEGLEEDGNHEERAKGSVHRCSPPQQRSNIDPMFLNQGLHCHCHHLEFIVKKEKNK